MCRNILTLDRLIQMESVLSSKYKYLNTWSSAVQTLISINWVKIIKEIFHDYGSQKLFWKVYYHLLAFRQRVWIYVSPLLQYNLLPQWNNQRFHKGRLCLWVHSSGQEFHVLPNAAIDRVDHKIQNKKVVALQTRILINLIERHTTHHKLKTLCFSYF